MTRHLELDPDLEGSVSLQAQARANDIDRRISSLRFRRAFVNWLILPVFFAALAAMIVAWILGFGTRGSMLAGIITIAGGIALFFPLDHKLQDEITDLRYERRSILADLPPNARSRQCQIADDGAAVDKGNTQVQV